MLTVDQAAAAAAEGWGITTVVDNGSTTLYYMIVRCGERFKTDLEAGAYVLAKTRDGSKFHRDVLRGIALSRVNPAARKRKKP